MHALTLSSLKPAPCIRLRFACHTFTIGNLNFVYSQRCTAYSLFLGDAHFSFLLQTPTIGVLHASVPPLRVSFPLPVTLTTVQSSRSLFSRRLLFANYSGSRCTASFLLIFGVVHLSFLLQTTAASAKDALRAFGLSVTRLFSVASYPDNCTLLALVLFQASFPLLTALVAGG